MDDIDKNGDLLDRALERLHATDFEYESHGLAGLLSHGPMAAESLLGLGRPDRIEPFVTAYLGRLRPLTAASRAAVARHEQRLGDGDYRPALREALGELLPGAVGGAAHGWLRTAHAVRALAARDVPVRRRELAFGLASWAACATRLPGTPGARPQRGLHVGRALSAVPLVAPEGRADAALISERVVAVERLDGFADAIEAVDLAALPFSEAVSALAAAAARLFLATPGARFVYLHTVTATSALRLVESALDEDGKRRALGAVFQAVAALHATHADPRTAPRALEAPFAPDVPLARLVRSPSAIAARAAESLDDHDVKLADAALREHAKAPREELLAAAALRLDMAA